MELGAALEQAAVDLLRSNLGYRDAQCDRSFEGKPPPAYGGDYFVAVWHDGSRDSLSETSTYMVFGLEVTVTVRTRFEYDRWVRHRDQCEYHLNRIAALLHQDSYSYLLTNRANELANLGGVTQQIGATIPFRLARYDRIETKGPDWFQADLEEASDLPSGIAQTARFRASAWIREISHAE